MDKELITFCPECFVDHYKNFNSTEDESPSPDEIDALFKRNIPQGFELKFAPVHCKHKSGNVLNALIQAKEMIEKYGWEKI